MRPQPATSVCALAALLLSLGLASCGGGDEVSDDGCTSVDALKSSVSGLGDVNVSEGGLPALRTQATQIGADIKQVKADLGSEFDDEVEAVEKSTAALVSAVRAAVTTPSATSLSAVGPAAKSVSSEVDDLSTAVADAC